MAADIHQFFVSHKLTSGVNLLGHSMGGKAVMALALNSDLNRPLRSLISVDMSPARGKISPEWVLLKPTAGATDASERFASYTDAMMDIEKAQVKTKHEADVILQKTEPVRLACFFHEYLPTDGIYMTRLFLFASFSLPTLAFRNVLFHTSPFAFLWPCTQLPFLILGISLTLPHLPSVPNRLSGTAQSFL